MMVSIIPTTIHQYPLITAQILFLAWLISPRPVFLPLIHKIRATKSQEKVQYWERVIPATPRPTNTWMPIIRGRVERRIRLSSLTPSELLIFRWDFVLFLLILIQFWIWFFSQGISRKEKIPDNNNDGTETCVCARMELTESLLNVDYVKDFHPMPGNLNYLNILKKLNLIF